MQVIESMGPRFVKTTLDPDGKENFSQGHSGMTFAPRDEIVGAARQSGRWAARRGRPARAAGRWLSR
jgi:hypothetical protein